MSERPGCPTLIQSVQRALRLLEVVADHEGRAQAKELARAAGFNLATTYHLLRTLTHEGYLQRLDDNTYVLGQRLDVVLRHGTAARAVAQARPALEWLRDELHSPIYLALYDDGEIAVVDVVDSPKAPRIDLWVGIHDAAHATALGKCILGQLEPETRRAYLAEHPLHSLTQYTTVDCLRLRHELDTPNQFAIDNQEYAVGVACIGSAVETPHLTGAIAFTTTPRRLPGEPAMREKVEAAARRVSRALAVAGPLRTSDLTCP
jgi:IclR family acetate operon transcriptional repressor